MLGKSISKNSLILAAFAFVTAGSLATIFSATQGRIAEQKKLAAEKALLEIVPRKRHDNSMLDTTFAIPEPMLSQLGLDESGNVHIATKEGKPVAVILPSTAADGYSGDIDLLIGINTDGSISGVRVLSHRETPGLGDKVDLNKSEWILSFNDLSLTEPTIDEWTVKKDGGYFDQFTGATITPRAVVNRVKDTLKLFAEEQEAILAPLLVQEQADHKTTN